MRDLFVFIMITHDYRLRQKQGGEQRAEYIYTSVLRILILLFSLSHILCMI